MLNAAVVGLGVGEQHARTYVEEAGCTLRWVYDLDPDRMAAVIAKLGQGAAAVAFESILNDEKTDVVSLASYDDDHFAQVVAGLDARKHVFVEKPMCRSLTELREIKRAWESSGGRHLMSNLVLRGAPLYTWLRDAVAGGVLGEVYAFDGDYLYGRLHKITHGWRRDVENYSVMQGGGIHLMDLMLWLTGQRPTRVTAAGNRVSTEGSAFRYPDYVTTTFEFPSGLIGRITANFGCVHRHQHVVRIFGTRGTFLYDDQGPRLHETREPDACPRRLELAPLPAGKGVLIPAFVSAIRNDEPSALRAGHDFDVISACVAADVALAQHSTQEIEYV